MSAAVPNGRIAGGSSLELHFVPRERGGGTSLCGYLVFACCDHNMLWGAKRLSAINGHES